MWCGECDKYCKFVVISKAGSQYTPMSSVVAPTSVPARAGTCRISFAVNWKMGTFYHPFPRVICTKRNLEIACSTMI